MSWRDDAACRGRDDINWFPDPSDTRGLARAQLVCRDCPVKLECADHALVEGEKFGVWAGVNVGIATWERERARKNSERARARRSKKVLTDDERLWLRERYG